MLASIVVGSIFGIIFIIAMKKTIRDIKSNKCAGCSGGCTPKQIEKCNRNTDIK